MSGDPEFMESLLKGLTALALRTARPGIKDASRELAGAAVARYLGSFGDLYLGDVYIPQYWAVYVHDGRGPVSPRRRTLLVYYADPRKDPRRRGGRPERRVRERSLTKDQFRKLSKEIYEARKAGRRPPAYIVEDSGPADGHPFFDNGRGMAQFRTLSRTYIALRVRNYVRRELRNLIKFETIEDRTLRIFL